MANALNCISMANSAIKILNVTFFFTKASEPFCKIMIHSKVFVITEICLTFVFRSDKISVNNTFWFSYIFENLREL